MAHSFREILPITAGKAWWKDNRGMPSELGLHSHLYPPPSDMLPPARPYFLKAPQSLKQIYELLWVGCPAFEAGAEMVPGQFDSNP